MFTVRSYVRENFCRVAVDWHDQRVAILFFVLWKMGGYVLKVSLISKVQYGTVQYVQYSTYIHTVLYIPTDAHFDTDTTVSRIGKIQDTTRYVVPLLL
jgi:hypothetical protein